MAGFGFRNAKGMRRESKGGCLGIGALKIGNRSAEKAEQEPGLGARGSMLGNEKGVFLDRETLVVSGWELPIAHAALSL